MILRPPRPSRCRIRLSRPFGIHSRWVIAQKDALGADFERFFMFAAAPIQYYHHCWGTLDALVGRSRCWMSTLAQEETRKVALDAQLQGSGCLGQALGRDMFG